MKQGTLQVFRSIPLTEFETQPEKLFDHCQLVIDNNDAYIQLFFTYNCFIMTYSSLFHNVRFIF